MPVLLLLLLLLLLLYLLLHHQTYQIVNLSRELNLAHQLSMTSHVNRPLLKNNAENKSGFILFVNTNAITTSDHLMRTSLRAFFL